MPVTNSAREPSPSPRRLPGHSHGEAEPRDWPFLLMADLREQAVLRPWGPALMAVGVVHLVFFLVCQAVYTSGVRSEWVSLVLWGSELATVMATMRAVAGQGWLHESPAVGLIFRVWVTFLILSFNVAMLNTLTGWSVEWFKLVWCTLASFGFATMAWLFGYRLLVPAFQMYFTGLIMARFPQWAYLIHGASWCAALQFVGLDLNRRRARLTALHDAGPVEAESTASASAA